ncbi:hypothetical protein F5J12DRAFT_914663 [Pisolithus orientalis]|uniref:uncharacterized protein n=1 Tax=Pisolithus orientalis TaxID=936130 RepID=UPI0022246B98|nr:uncharacterized protein F5J12DRAFT_914663 [Pisolithus orientalis]KAI5998352.1 hypothetical protein F5J12DRAFT_914663 [Pisolithus orientalis]
MVVHMSCLLDSCGGPRTYRVQDFLLVARNIKTAARVAACDLYHIPSLSSCYHEFLLARVDIGVDGEKLMLIIERAPKNNGIRVVFSNGGVAKDTITVVRALEDHEYWQQAGQIPVCRGTLQWRDHSPHLLDIVSISGTASAVFKYYNCYVRQCYWYARVILASMAKAFPSCSKEGTTSFSKRRFAIFGSHKLDQVQLLVDLHAICRQDACASLPPARPPFIVTPDSLQAISSAIAGCLETSLAQIVWLQPAAGVVNGCCDRTIGREPTTAGGWT